MKWLAALGVLFFLAGASQASAQLQVSVETERANFLLYERVDLIVSLTNVSGSDLLLNNDEGRSWLSFMVTKHNHLPVRTDHTGNFAPLTLKDGETKTLRVNLTPLFAFREEGDYNASAVIDLPGQSGQLVSTSVPFLVSKGRTVVSQLRTVDSSQRIYSLIRFSSRPDSTQLYLRVESPTENVVFANLALGEMVSSIDPELFFDPDGDVHVLQPVALGTYLYSRADPEGKVLDQRIFKTYQMVPPHLAKLADGHVVVNGGRQENPTMPQEKLSEAQVAKKATVVPAQDLMR